MNSFYADHMLITQTARQSPVLKGPSEKLCIEKDGQYKEGDDEACRKLYKKAFH